jgi:hypothetical protein
MTRRDWRNLVFIALIAALCFAGGSFTCSTNSHDNDDDFDGHVTVSAVL